MNDLKNQESYTFYEDSAHGWLKVPFHELRYLNIVDDISEFSYMNQRTQEIYLEEDCDTPTFLKAYESNFGKVAPINHVDCGEFSFVRNLASYNKNYLLAFT